MRDAMGNSAGQMPAFPQTETANGNPFCNEHGDNVMGITIRDYFAAKALSGMMAKAAFGPEAKDNAATVCYMMADAMLAAREVQP